MKQGLHVIVGLLLVVLAVCSCRGTEEQERSATVTEVVNKVDAHARPQEDWGPAGLGMVVYGGGRVRTGAASSACLEMLEGMVRLSADTLFAVKESLTRQDTLVTTLSLEAGRLWTHLMTAGPHEFTVETGYAVVTVRDTFFAVNVDPSGRTLVSVAVGTVVLTAQEQSVTVAAGQQATVEPDRPPSPPEPMSEEEGALWAAEVESGMWNLEGLDLIYPTAPPEVVEEVIPTPTPTPTSTPTPTPTSTPTPTPIPEPQDVDFAAADDQELAGTYYPPPVCPAPLTVVYYPWVRGDKGDFEKLAALLPPDLSYSALTITPRGCEGGCQEWDPSGWSLDYLAALETAKGLPCAEDSRLVTIGSSVGADGAVYACGQEESCVGALSFSAGGYLDVPFADLVATTVEQGKYVWAVMAQDDAGATQLARTEWGDYYREIVIPGSAHGDQLYDADTGKIIQDFIDCATHSFELEKCVGF